MTQNNVSKKEPIKAQETSRRETDYPEREKQLNVVERAIQKAIACSNCLGKLFKSCLYTEFFSDRIWICEDCGKEHIIKQFQSDKRYKKTNMEAGWRIALEAEKNIYWFKIMEQNDFPNWHKSTPKEAKAIEKKVDAGGEQ